MRLELSSRRMCLEQVSDSQSTCATRTHGKGGSRTEFGGSRRPLVRQKVRTVEKDF